MADPLLEVKNLVTTFATDHGRVRAIDGVNLKIYPGQTVGLVGESGCGKSVTALSILRLIEPPSGQIHSGEVCFSGRNLLSLSTQAMRAVRGNEISMVFQEPMTSLNPVFTIGNQLSEVFRIHRGLTAKAARAKSLEMLKTVRLADPERRLDEYPHQLSGGMRQRVLIATALACQPQVLIADEPTTALDVTIQAQILSLMAQLQDEFGMAILFITHDLGVVAEMCDQVVIMYAGQVVEQAPVEEIFTNPKHPYTQGLMASIPSIHTAQERLHTIAGSIPPMHARPQGCRFSPRCPAAKAICHQKAPRLETRAKNHAVACFLYDS